jgi:DNA-binding NarL/FixJ family response regulator
MITVALVDDHELVRTGFRYILADHKDFAIVGEAGSGEEAIQIARKLKPQVMLMDLHLPGLSGLEATERIVKADPKVRVIIVSMHDEDPFPRRLLEVGASGYVTKTCPAEELVGAIRQVARGGKYLSPAIAQRLALASMPGRNKTSPFDQLSKRELEIAMALARGESMPTIAARLNISPKTVATHKYRVYAKLDIDSEVALTLLALQYGLISKPSPSL